MEIEIRQKSDEALYTALCAMRNPLNSWSKLDSEYVVGIPDRLAIGADDMRLARQLYKAGPEHRKFNRLARVILDITAPLYWWKQFDTYKVGVDAVSTSTMHKIMSRPLDLSDFEHDAISDQYMQEVVDVINELIKAGEFRAVVQLLPESYLQLRTVSISYETIERILEQRKNHKLPEWRQFCEFLENEIPYVSEFREGKA